MSDDDMPVAPEEEPYEDPEGIPMTVFAFNGNFWLYEGDDLLDDLLFGRGRAPFPVRLVHFKDRIELARLLGPDFVITTHWRIHPDIMERVRRDGLLVDVYASDI